MFHIEDRGPARWLIIDDPTTKNAITADAWKSLTDHLRAFEESDQKTLVVTGANGDFCAGANVGGMADRIDGVEAARRGMKQVEEAATTFRMLTKPTIAAVEGVAAGAGMNLALSCDVVLASRTARFSEIFVKRGVMLDFGGTWLLPRHVGLQRAKELAYTGRIVEGPEAARIGLALEVVEPEVLADRAQRLAGEFSAGAPLAIMFDKQGIERGITSTFEEAVAFETTAQAICLTSEDAAEGMRSFLEKRPPRFQGR